VIGVGGTGVMNSVLYALATLGFNREVLVQAPYYNNYKGQVENTMSFVNGTMNGLKFNLDADPELHTTFEINTYPNNPDGRKRAPLVSDPSRVIYDCVYNWPQYTAIDEDPLEGDIMIFSASKNTGHAGTRLGWALVKDPEIADKMREFVARSLGVSIDTQLRIYSVLKSINSDFVAEKSGFYDWGSSTMNDRFDQVDSLFGESGVMREIEFVNRKERGAYVWLKCLKGIDCQRVLREEVFVEGNSGIQYGVGGEYVRIQFMARSVEIEQFLISLKNFFEGGDKLGRGYEMRDGDGGEGRTMGMGMGRGGGC